jgi:hypothetical protein
VVVATGGKPYYTAGLIPALLAAGTPTVARWVVRRQWRRILAYTMLALQVVITVFVALPVIPPANLANTPVTAVNYDTGETIGWDRFVDTVVAASQRMTEQDPGRTVVLTANYGEAGALDRARRRGAPLPPIYSGHNGYGLWGPPPDDVTSVLLLGDFSDAGAARLFATCTVVDHVDNGLGLDNEEQGVPLRHCRRPLEPWSRVWPRIVSLG